MRWRFWALWGVLLGGAVVAQVVGILDRGGLFPQLITIALYASIIVIWIVVIRVQRRQVEHMAQHARTVLAREDRDLLG